MKNGFFKCFLIMLFSFAFAFPVNAEVGKYTYQESTYCYNADGSFGAVLDALDTGACNASYYGGTIFKQINGQDAYCTQGEKYLSTDSTCTLASYNQYGYMNGNWTEANAIKSGYIIQYIKSKNLGHDTEYVYIFNALNYFLQFEGISNRVIANSLVKDAINYANNMYDILQDNKLVRGTPIAASFNGDLENVGTSYSKGVIDLTLSNRNAFSTMTVTASCNNCKLYTDSELKNEFTGVKVEPTKSSTMKLYVKTNGMLAANTNVEVSFNGAFSSFNYLIAKLWDCGTDRQAVATLSNASVSLAPKSFKVSATVKEVKRYCVAVDGRYYGKDGKETTEARYKEDCLSICKVVDGKYFGRDGKETTKAKYEDQCLSICKVVDGKYFGRDGKETTKAKYEDQCLSICKVVDGKYFGRDGKETTKAKYEDQCLSICKVVDGKYFGRDGKEITEAKYKDECMNICKVVDGKYFGRDGKEVSLSVYNSQCISTPVTVKVPNTGTTANNVNVILGSALIALGLGFVKFSKKRFQ